MVDWENKPVNIKDDYDEAKLYFEGLVQDFKTYMQNSGGGSGKMGYKSANQMADVDDKIRKYIQKIANASVASNKKQSNLQPTSAKNPRPKTPSCK